MAKKIQPDKTLFYYMTGVWDEVKHPKITVCLAWFGSVICRGVSIYSPSEKNFNKKHSRGRALRRAKDAFRSKEDRHVIRRSEAFEVLNACSAPFAVKGAYGAMLTHFEHKLTTVPNHG